MPAVRNGGLQMDYHATKEAGDVMLSIDDHFEQGFTSPIATG